MTPSTGLLMMALALAGAADEDAPLAAPPAAKFTTLGADAVQDLVILAETRPILLRVRIMIGDRSFRAAWTDGIRALYSWLDGNGDGKLTSAEAEKNGLALFLNPANPPVPAPGRTEVDIDPKDGVISLEELTNALHSTFGPFRLQVESIAERRTDALFDQLDRDKDGELSRSEMETIIGSLHRLDRDADELIDAGEVVLVSASIPTPMMPARSAREPAVPPVLELTSGEPPLRSVRMLIKKYDTGSSRGPGRRDSRLSPEEIDIPSAVFVAADRNRDGTLNTEELRAYLARAPRDAILDVALTADGSGRVAAAIRGGEGSPRSGLSVRQHSAGVIEIDVGLIRLDIHVDDAAGAAEAARKAFRVRFDSADANQDGYLEMDELSQDNGQLSPLLGQFKAIDRDGDGKLYPRELDEFVAKQAVASRGRVRMFASDEGRALFGMLDLDRDRALGAREVMGAFARVSACDRNRDGRVTPDEIPHHIRLVLERGDLSFLLAPSGGGRNVLASPGVPSAPPRSRRSAGPSWFRKMDRNHDGDVSPREFLGSRQQFDRLDRDHDGLLSPGEAAEASAGRSTKVRAPGD